MNETILLSELLTMLSLFDPERTRVVVSMDGKDGQILKVRKTDTLYPTIEIVAAE